jgi:5-methylcytosine-specific restriction endonuclease McrA
MKIIADNNIELDAEVNIDNDGTFLGLFLESRGGKLGDRARNPDYYQGLDLILKRLYERNVKEIRVFISSLKLPISAWNLKDRELFLKTREPIKLSSDYSRLRKEICNAQSKLKRNPNTKGGNPTKRIFIYTNIEATEWENLIRNQMLPKSELNKISDFEKDEMEQNLIIKNITKYKKTKETVLRELLDFSAVVEDKIQIGSKGYKRDNQAIARIKYLRDFKCQICGTSIKKKDGQFYVEAAHIDPKRLKGKETLDNIILLCPNHHKEFDLGNSEIVNRDDKVVLIKLNGVSYMLSLDIVTTLV